VEGRLAVVHKGFADQLSIALPNVRATAFERRTALLIAIAALIAFALTTPFVRIPLARMPAFILAYQGALFLIDLVTAAVLLDQFVRIRTASMLVLASGYLFDALMIIPHTLSFPGAFAPTGLLGAKEQTTAWLYIFWHGGFPLFVIAYAILRRREEYRMPPMRLPVRWLIAASVLTASLLAASLTLVATWGHDALPVVMQGNDYSLLVQKGVSPTVWVLTLIAIASLWRRNIPLMDLWLMLVMWIWLFDIALAAVLGSNRFDLGFYAGRLYGLLAASFLLVALLLEMMQMYSGPLAALAPQTVTQPKNPDAPRAAPQQSTSTQTFIREKNIAHFRALLESDRLNEAERRTIAQLLREASAEQLKRPS
jgi:hypothetical protein